MRFTAAFALVAAAAVSAQVPSYNSSLDMTIDPNSVPVEERATWCQGQRNTCDLLCGDEASVNDCTQNDLNYECACASNNSAPGLQYYTQTMPTFICAALFGQCNAQNVGDASGQEDCQTNIQEKCGTVDPPKAAVGGDDDGDDEDGDDEASTSTTTDASGSATSAPDSTPTDNEEEVESTTSDGFAAPTLAPAGNGVAAIAAIGVLAYLI